MKVGRSTDQYVPPVMFKGYKPLTCVDDTVYFFHRGSIFAFKDDHMQRIMAVRGKNWKDRSRILVRLLRSEPKYAVSIGQAGMLLVGSGKVILVDPRTGTRSVLTGSREGFSDPLNILTGHGNWLAIWGDYGPNRDHVPVNIYGLNRAMDVETIYTFRPGQIRHVHNIVPRLEGGYYIFTGDQEEEAGIYQADASFRNVTPAAIGEQRYRSVVGFDTPQGLLYATDAVNEKNYIYLLSKEGRAKELFPMNGSCIYGRRLERGYMFSTTVEPDENNRGLFSWLSYKRGEGILSDEVYLVYVDEDLREKTLLRYKKDLWPMKLMQYGSIQFMRGESRDVWIYPVAVKKYDGTAIKLEKVCYPRNG